MMTNPLNISTKEQLAWRYVTHAHIVQRINATLFVMFCYRHVLYYIKPAALALSTNQ